MKNKHYPIDQTIIHNKQKWVWAFIWHKGKLKRITNQQAEPGYVVVDDRHKVLKTSLRLAKIGDKVILSGELPARHTAAITTITHFRGNGSVGTGVDLHEFDDTNYTFFSRYEN